MTETLEAARAGDEVAFGRLVAPYRGELQAHCYRMLASTQDAEDALQDVLVRAWRSLGRFEGRSSLRSWLYTIATNVCLDELARASRRTLPVDYGPAADPHLGPGAPLVESVWVEPFAGTDLGSAGPEASYELRESVELAFIVALQHLPARQRAALILREVLGFSAKEVAEALQTTVPAVNSALQRARASLEDRLPDRSQQATLAALGDERVGEIVQGYLEAWERGDVDAVVGQLAEDAIIAMPPMPTWYAGREACRTFLAEFAFARAWRGDAFVEGERRVRLLATTANGQPAIATYRRTEDGDGFVPYNLQVLALDGDGRIASVTGFVGEGVPAGFDLPATLR